jgi:hypothetical protein
MEEMSLPQRPVSYDIILYNEETIAAIDYTYSLGLKRALKMNIFSHLWQGR